MIARVIGVALFGLAMHAGAQPAPADTEAPALTKTPASSTSNAPAATSVAQQALDEWDDKVSDFDKLKTPDSPAFVILGISPTEIQHPTTPKAVAVALGSFVTESEITIPKNYAFEVAPYWLFSHPDLDARHYRDDRVARLYRSLSISIGTAQANRTTFDVDGASIAHIDSDVGLGVRTLLFQSGASEDDECTRQANAYGVEMSAHVALTAREQQDIQHIHAFGTPEYNEAVAEAQRAKAVKVQESAAKTFAAQPKCVASAASAQGLSIGIAGAVDAHVVDSRPTKNNTSFAGSALWLNVSYDRDALAAVAMVRYASHDTMMGAQRVVDGGLRAIYKAKNFAASTEGLSHYRFSSASSDWNFKVDVAIEYELGMDTWISVTFGKDFTFTPGEQGSLFSLANIKWDLGKPKVGNGP
jgi:hypothetical protein